MARRIKNDKIRNKSNHQLSSHWSTLFNNPLEGIIGLHQIINLLLLSLECLLRPIPNFHNPLLHNSRPLINLLPELLNLPLHYPLLLREHRLCSLRLKPQSLILRPQLGHLRFELGDCGLELGVFTLLLHEHAGGELDAGGELVELLLEVTVLVEQLLALQAFFLAVADQLLALDFEVLVVQD